MLTFEKKIEVRFEAKLTKINTQKLIEEILRHQYFLIVSVIWQ